jgi:hypothetical protein
VRSHPQSRREFIRSFSFSAAALLGTRSFVRAAGAVDASAQHLLVFGDWGAVMVEPQQKVAAAMAAYLRSQSISPSALLLLGDNFYGNLDGGTASPRWQSQFEQMYPAATFACPCYAILGNHDYNVEPLGKAEAQLAYANAQPETRWKMPAKWYRFDFPAHDPLVTFVMLDSNYQKATSDKLALTDAERAEQIAWLKAELAKPRGTKFLVVCGHHPLYSAGGDNPHLIAEWDALLREQSAHLYFCGHVHDLEHLELPGHPTSFVVSGGGGTTIRQSTVSKTSASNEFGQNIHGFTHLEARNDRLVVRHLSDEGNLLHGFSKTAAGQVQVL